MRKHNETVRKPAIEVHRTECWIRASESSVRALHQLLRALDEQQSPNWRRPHRRIRRASRHFKRAKYWADEGLKNPLKHSGTEVVV